MADHTEDARDEGAKQAERRPYQSPRLVVYGNLPKLVAMAKPGARADGGGLPKTKT